MSDQLPSEDAGSAGERYTRDPKDMVTETAFRVDSRLLGVPLASPWRRLGAILVDLVAVGGLVLFKEISAGLFVMSVAWIMWRVARQDVDVHVRQAWLRGLVRIAAIVTFVAGAGVFIDQVTSGGSPEADDEARQVREGMEKVAFSAVEDRMRGALRTEAEGLMDDLIAAAGAGDSARVEELREEVFEASVRSRVRPLRDRIDRLEDRLEEARSSPPGITDILGEILNDLGLGFSWLAFYFTAFLRVWRGRSPGKRLLGVRVVKVRGGEIGWWDSFGRFGGYAACVITGLVGFAQVFWDPNRQGLHDRIAGTVVIRE